MFVCRRLVILARVVGVDSFLVVMTLRSLRTFRSNTNFLSQTQARPHSNSLGAAAARSKSQVFLVSIVLLAAAAVLRTPSSRGKPTLRTQWRLLGRTSVRSVMTRNWKLSAYSGVTRWRTTRRTACRMMMSSLATVLMWTDKAWLMQTKSQPNCRPADAGCRVPRLAT